jgi:ABC-type multidrug transport system ATPase subunit
LDINAGQVYGLLGPNGAGKTTLIRQMAGLSLPTSGDLSLFGHSLIHEPKIAGQIVAVQPQGSALPVQSRPREVIEITGQIRGLSAGEAKKDTDDLLERFGLIPHANKRIVELSGGLRRLVNIASTLIGSRPVLILDEPTNDLDPVIRRVVWDGIKDISKSGTTIILVTHNVVEAEQALDRVAIMKEGRILSEGTPGELKAQINDKVRIEVSVKQDIKRLDVMNQIPEFYSIGDNRYALMVEREMLETKISNMLQNFNCFEDFKIVTPSLEDVYLKLSGGKEHENK